MVGSRFGDNVKRHDKGFMSGREERTGEVVRERVGAGGSGTNVILKMVWWFTRSSRSSQGWCLGLGWERCGLSVMCWGVWCCGINL